MNAANILLCKGFGDGKVQRRRLIDLALFY
ncbi:MAG: hypothetical protein ACI8SC_002883 [Colwellia sp.]